jgi:hypothetical protein
MSDTAAATTQESERTKYNRRLREKRAKGHSLDMIVTYAAKCPVPLDQLDLTSEESAEIERRRREEADRKERIRIEAEERARRERERRKAKVEAVEATVKEVSADKIVPVDAAVYDELAASGILLISLSFRPTKEGREWKGNAVTNDYAQLGGDYQQYNVEAKDYRLRWMRLHSYQDAPDPLKKALQSAEGVRARLKSKLPESETTLLGTIDIHVATRTAVLDYRHLPDMSDVSVLFDILAQQRIATVNIEFHTEDSSVVSDGQVDFLDADGKDMEIDIEDLEDGCLSDAFDEHWKEYASEAIVGDTFRPRYAHADDGSFFQDANGTVTFNILGRRISLSATATVERVVEEEEDIEETWSVDETESEAA